MNNTKPIRIGTRHSQLALWQAQFIKTKIELLGYKTQIVPIKSLGDTSLTKPLYEMGTVGIFTKSLDIALLDNNIDIAVHSMKDVPTQYPNGIKTFAVTKRDSHKDILVHNTPFLEDNCATIATSSLRRKAQWLNKYPHHNIENIRGNLILRLEKLQKKEHWNGAIFAKAGIDRLKINYLSITPLNWMIPAPAQGAIVVVGRENDTKNFNIIKPIEDYNTKVCTHIERQFLRTLEGGCTAPIGALATISRSTISFKGILLSEDGRKAYRVEDKKNTKAWEYIGEDWAKEILKSGGGQILKTLNHE